MLFSKNTYTKYVNFVCAMPIFQTVN